MLPQGENIGPRLVSAALVIQPLWVLHRFSSVQLFVTLWTVAHQAPLSMKFSRQEYSELPCPLPRDLPNTRIEPEPV